MLETKLDLKEKFKMVFTVSLFFPLILETLFKISNTLDSGSIILMWSGIVIAVLIFCYLLVTYIKTIRTIKIINRLLSINLLAYAVVIFLLAMIQHQPIASYFGLLFKIFFGSLIVIPGFILVLMFVDILYYMYKPIFSNLKGVIKK